LAAGFARRTAASPPPIRPTGETQTRGGGSAGVEVQEHGLFNSHYLFFDSLVKNQAGFVFEKSLSQKYDCKIPR
jgi:hypothetical protein